MTRDSTSNWPAQRLPAPWCNLRHVVGGWLVLIAFAVAPLIAADRSTDSAWLDVARSSITNTALHSHIDFLAADFLEGREGGSRGARAAAKYIVDRLQEAEIKPAGTDGSFLQSFPGNHQNILAIIPGDDPELKHETILISAHYDHVGYGSSRNSFGPIGYIHNGADDNASGVAALLEVIDALSRTDYRPRRSILFAFWDAEEKGLLGSKHWVRQPTVPLRQVKLSINVDMVGRMSDGRIEVGGTRSGKGLRQLMSTPGLPGNSWLDFTWDYKDNSDHWTFYQASIPSLYLHTGVHDDYHRPSDNVEKINLDGLRTITGYLLEKACHLADVDELAKFRTESRLETPYAQKRREKPLEPLHSRVHFSWKSDGQRLEVTQVRSSTPRAEAGEFLPQLQSGDRIVAVNEAPVDSEATFVAHMWASESELLLTVERSGVEEPLHIEVPLMGNPVRLGISWREDSAEPGSVYVTRVVPFSPAGRAGLALGDRLLQLEGEPVEGREQLFQRVQSKLEEGATSLAWVIESRGIVQELLVPLDISAVPAGDPSL